MLLHASVADRQSIYRSQRESKSESETESKFWSGLRSGLEHCNAAMRLLMLRSTSGVNRFEIKGERRGRRGRERRVPPNISNRLTPLYSIKKVASLKQIFLNAANRLNTVSDVKVVLTSAANLYLHF